MSIIEILYPTDKQIIYGDSFTFRYDIKNNVKSNYLKFVVLQLDDSTEVRIPWTDRKYFLQNISAGDHTLIGYLEDSRGTKVKQSDFELNFIAITEKYEPSNQTWSIITDKLPAFIREDYKTFTAFIKAYFEWTNKSNNPVYSLYSSGDFSDIDTSPEIFLESFRVNYLNDFPANILDLKDTVNIRNVIKNIKHYYSSKGTEKAYKFLFRLLYKTYVEIQYPRNLLLKASGSLWVENKFIKVRGLNSLSDTLKSNLIYQYGKDLAGKPNKTIVASARIQDVIMKKIDNETIYELQIDNIVGSFGVNTGIYNYTAFVDSGISGEEVFIDTILDGEISRQSAYLIQNITLINVTTPGLVPGDNIIVTPGQNSTGNSFSALVAMVDKSGVPTDIRITNTGYDYRGDNFNILVKRGDTESALKGNVSTFPVFFEPGYHETNVSSPSSNGILQDNRKYQELSYVIKTGIMESEFLDIIKRLIHPAGFAVYTEQYVQSYEKTSFLSNVSTANLFFKPLLGNLIAHQFNSTANIRNTGDEDYPDLYPNGFDPSQPVPDHNNPNTYFVHTPSTNGAINTFVESVRFSYLPNVSDIDKRNEYWVVYPSLSFILGVDTPLKDLKIKDIIQIFAGTLKID